MKTETIDKIKSNKVSLLLTDLNNLSVKKYEYVYRSGEKHFLYYRTAYNTRKLFRYTYTLDDMIFILELLIKYRITEYEADDEI